MKTKRNITIKQHYVPQFYLKMFVNYEGKLQCYNIQTKREFCAFPKDICFKNNGYETQFDIENHGFILHNKIEKMFACLEAQCAPVLKQIITKCESNSNGKSLICSREEKEILASMVSNFIVRNFCAVNSFIDNDEVRRLIETDEEIQTIDSLLHQMNLGSVKPFIEYTQKEIFLNQNEDGVAKRIMSELLGMNLSFFVTNELNFVTSDCPVAYNCDDKEIFMAMIPLNPKVIAIYSKSNISKQFRNKSQKLDVQYVKKINRGYIDWKVPQLIIAKEKNDIDIIK